MTLVVTICTSAIWQQRRGVEIEDAERVNLQSRWLIDGGSDWARMILSKDARNPGIDHLGEPWSLALNATQVSRFLSTKSEFTDEANPDAYLLVQIQDLQSRINVLNLVQGGRVHPPTYLAFQRLFEALQLSSAELELLVAHLQSATSKSDEHSIQDKQNASRPILPRSSEQLSWLGLSPSTVAGIKDYVVVLPERTPVNLNTAPPAVLQFVIPGLDMAGAFRMAQVRRHNHFRTLTDAMRAAGLTGSTDMDGSYSLGSKYFEILVRCRFGRTLSQERRYLRRDGKLVNLLWTRREGAA